MALTTPALWLGTDAVRPMKCVARPAVDMAKPLHRSDYNLEPVMTWQEIAAEISAETGKSFTRQAAQLAYRRAVAKILASGVDFKTLLRELESPGPTDTSASRFVP